MGDEQPPTGRAVTMREVREALGHNVDRSPVPEEQPTALTDDERSMLRYALDLAEDHIANEPTEFTDADRDAVESLKRLANGPVVAYRNLWQPGVLLCREHGNGWAGLTPLTSDDLPDGGICTHGDPADPSDVCGRDVLA
ncbi:hypothetical protein ABTY20_19225 [Streptomyces sp. NPDC126497]|uniref:hypothetical protein n=1 Tax=Streptomyces sp. NPDC126497 TaxID=3155313 RepID=UPI00332685AC